jgi:hypothetical protein
MGCRETKEATWRNPFLVEDAAAEPPLLSSPVLVAVAAGCRDDERRL